MASLAVVGLGYGAGEQVTLRGHDLLLRSGWIGHFGLPPPLVAFLSRYPAERVDLDAALQSDRFPDGFTLRAAHLALAAAAGAGQAALAVGGHPCFANNATRLIAALAPSAGLELELAAAPSILDAFAEDAGLLGVDVASPGSALVEARALLAQGYALDPRLALVLWNAGYLPDAQRHALGLRLLEAWGHDWTVSLYRRRAPRRPGDWATYPLARLDVWSLAVDHETTVIVPARSPT